MDSYFGGKGQASAYQTLINQIPPHDVYIAPFAGRDAIFRNIVKKREWFAYLIDLDPEPLESLDVDPKRHHLVVGDGVHWVRTMFSLDHLESWTPFLHPQKRKFIFFDPPYLGETRTSTTRYRFDLQFPEEHEELLETVKAASEYCNVMITHYPNQLYNKMLAGWRRIKFSTVARSGEKRTEHCWMSYPEPTELHDYQYLGRDKREKEKLRRRANNLVAKLDRLPQKEAAHLIQILMRDDRCEQ